MKQEIVSRSIVAGFVATMIMTVIMYLAPTMGMPKMDIAAMLGGFITQNPAPPWSGVWALGMFVHFLLGTAIFPMVYSLALHPRLSGKPWLKGVYFGIGLWLLAEMIVMPLVGNGFFARLTPQPLMSVVGSLLGHIIYGAILGALYGDPIGFKERTVTTVKEEQVPVS